MSEDYQYTDLITCPWCGYEYHDSCDFEFDGEDEYEGIECPECEKIFSAFQNISISYSTFREYCEDGKHDYKLDDTGVYKKKYVNREWILAEESEWEYYKYIKCETCHKRERVVLTKEEYKSLGGKDE